MMNSNFLYQEWGLCSFECTKVEYDGKTIILDVQSKKRLFFARCAKSLIWSRMCIVSAGVGANRRSECNHLNEDTTLQMQKRGM